MADWIVPLITLTTLEIVLGIDNIIFLAIIAGKLPKDRQPKARRIGLLLALGMRLLLLLFIGWLMGMDKTIAFTLPAMPFFESDAARAISVKDLILLVGGLFLIGKSTFEIHEKLEGEEAGHKPGGGAKAGATFAGVLIQIVLIDIVFSLDSVITGVGMVKSIDDYWIIAVAMVIAVGVMIAVAGSVSDFIARHPTLKMLALSFLILIGVMLVAEGLGQHFNKGYIYFAMAFAVGVELLNMGLRKKGAAVTLRKERLPK